MRNMVLVLVVGGVVVIYLLLFWLKLRGLA
jgi:hypothetical protein